MVFRTLKRGIRWVTQLLKKIIKAHLLSSGEMTVGSDIGLKIDQTLTQDATGTMAYLEFEAMGVPRVKTEKSVCFILTTIHCKQALKMRTTTDLFKRLPKTRHLLFPSSNGICHQVHLERFGIPGKNINRF